MDQLEMILEDYEKNLNKAREGKCKKVSQCMEFRESFKRQYQEKYKQVLEEMISRLVDRGHHAEVEERPPKQMHYGFSFYLIPRHILTCPVDRFFPSDLRSSISFVANEHTRSIDVETIINPNVEKLESTLIDKVSWQEFNEELLIHKIDQFIEKVFNETIILDFQRM